MSDKQDSENSPWEIRRSDYNGAQKRISIFIEARPTIADIPRPAKVKYAVSYLEQCRPFLKLPDNLRLDGIVAVPSENFTEQYPDSVVAALNIRLEKDPLNRKERRRIEQVIDKAFIRAQEAVERQMQFERQVNQAMVGGGGVEAYASANVSPAIGISNAIDVFAPQEGKGAVGVPLPSAEYEGDNTRRFRASAFRYRNADPDAGGFGIGRGGIGTRSPLGSPRIFAANSAPPRHIADLTLRNNRLEDDKE